MSAPHDIPVPPEAVQVALIGAIPVVVGGVVMACGRLIGGALAALQRRRNVRQSAEKGEQDNIIRRTEILFKSMQQLNDHLEAENKRISAELDELRERMRVMQHELDLCRKGVGA